MTAEVPHVSAISASSSLLEVCPSTTRLDDSLHSLLRLIPVLMVQVQQINTVMFGNATQGVVAVLVMHETDTDTDTSETTCSAYTVEICLGVALLLTGTLHGDIVVDDHRYGLHVDTTGQNVGGDKDLSLAGSESVDDSVTVGTLLASGKVNHLVTLGRHALLDTLSALTCPNKDDRGTDGHQAVELDEDVVLGILAGAVHEHLLDAGNGKLLMLQFDLVSLGAELLRELHHLVGESGGEKEDLGGWW
jgi:hypothetical protein